MRVRNRHRSDRSVAATLRDLTFTPRPGVVTAVIAGPALQSVLLAGDGRTVLRSGRDRVALVEHADDVALVHGNRLVWHGPVSDLLARSGGQRVLVRSGDDRALASVLNRAGIRVIHEPGRGLTVVGAAQDLIARLAGTAGIVVHETVSSLRAGLEEALDVLTHADAPPITA